MRKNNYTYYFLGICLLFLFQACGGNDYVLPRDKMEKVLYDFQLAQALYQTRSHEFGSDEKKEALLNSIFEKHGITKEVFDSSLIWYSDHIDVYLRVNDSLLSSMKRYNDILEQQIRRSSDMQSLLASRTIPPYYYLTKEKPYLSFNMDSNLIKKGTASYLSLDFDVLGGYPNMKLNLSLLFEYADTSVTRSERISKESYSIEVDALKNRDLRNISGYIHADSLSTTYKLLLYNINLQQDSSKASLDTIPKRGITTTEKIRERQPQ